MNDADPLYLDHAASTPPAEEVVEAMLPWLRDMHANPHADHWHGRCAADAVEQARHTIAELIDADPDGIVFTSGVTEANNLALKGLLTAGGSRSHLWLSDTEHKSLLEPAYHLSQQGVEVRRLSVTETGVIEPSTLAASLAGVPTGCSMIAVAHGNNEIGTIQAINELSQVTHIHGHLIHVDASQTAGRLPLAVREDDIDSLCLSSHKMYGPAGIGALYLAPELFEQIHPLLHGGGQERGIRSGTIAPFLAVGFGTAAAIAKHRMAQDSQWQATLTQTFLDALFEWVTDFRVIGDTVARLPGHLSLQFQGIAADDMLMVLQSSLSASSGAACTSGELRASHVLRAIGMDETAASQVVRVSFGRDTTVEQAIEAAQRIAKAIKKIQGRDG